MKRLLLPIALVLVVGLAVVASVTPAQSQSGNLWGADYWNNPNWSGSPVMTQQISFISLDWGYGSPGSNVPADNFTARFNTDAFFNGTTYYFTVVADDEFALIVDGNTVFDTRGRGQSGKSFTIPVAMWQGQHRIEVLYREFTQLAYVFVNWSTCSNCAPPTPAPPGQLWPSLPPSEKSVITEFGDFTPCIQNNWHQKECFIPTWNLDYGSISMENQIQSWRQCGPADSVQTFFISPERPAVNYKCSKTLAGWFPD